MRKIALAIVTISAVASCTSGAKPLHNLRDGGTGPDEFAVLPATQLEIPQEMTLPTPTPGRANRADATPNADAIAVLGGRPSAASAGAVPARDAALVTRASRYGVTSDIRAQLASEDAAFRQGKKRFGLLSVFAKDRYFSAYAGQALDASAELQRFRNLGVATPSAPPAE